MAGRVSKVEPVARLGDLNVTYGFQVEDQNGIPLLLRKRSVTGPAQATARAAPIGCQFHGSS